ncbi:sensor histidine kinase [Tessaracoccus sp. Y36]
MDSVLDESRAPAHQPAADGLPWYRRMVMQGGLYIAPGAAFVLIPIVFASGAPLHIWLFVVATSLLLAFLVVGSTAIAHWNARGRWLWMAAVLGTVGLMALSPGETMPIYQVPYITTTAAVLLPFRHSRVVILVTTAVAILTALVERNLQIVVMGALALAMGLVIALALETSRTRDRLRLSEQRTAVLAVAAERERIGRDLHDILGHSLTAVAVKADLAERLIDRDATAARAEVAELAQIARQALADVRATASGMRKVRLASEIASARSVLTAAGIEAVIPTALPALDDRTSELLGYVVRESVTNVVRHASASTCTICYSDGVLTVSDDGRGIGDRERNGTGLSGLRARVAESGGQLEVVAGGVGTTVVASTGASPIVTDVSLRASCLSKIESYSQSRSGTPAVPEGAA